MTAKPTEDDIPLPPETSEEVYQYLARSLRRKRGFGLFFVQCTPAQATDIIAKLKDDLPQKKMQELRLDRDSTTLYDQVETLWQQQPFDVLFVTNLEQSVLAYEDTKRLSGWGDPELIYTVSWKGVPPILSHLNQQRERFRDHFGCSFVFLLPPFAIKYFIHHAPDFFDWRSGLFIVPPDEGDFQQESAKLLSDNWNDYTELTPEARTEKLLGFQDHIEHNSSLNDTQATRADLLCQYGLLHDSDQQYAQALVSYEKALEMQPTNEKVWTNRGNALMELGRYEDAIASYDKALAINQDSAIAWNNRGAALENLKRYEDAIASFDRTVTIKPDSYQGWSNRGNALRNLERYEDAITSYDRAVAIKPDDHEAWNNRGNALLSLGRYEDAITSYDRSVAIKPDKHEAWYNWGIALDKLGRYEEAIASYDQAVAINPDYREAWNNRGIALGHLGREDEATESFNKAIALNPEYGNQNG